MLEEVDAWVTSDEENQTEFALLTEDLRKERQNFRTHYTSLGKATNFLEQAFQEIESSVVKYEEATNNGDYGQARQLILDAREQLDETQEKIAKIPDWRTTLKTQVPRNLNEVELGIAEMEKQGYILEHFSLQDEISALRKQAEEELRNIERDQLADTPQTITHIHDRIDEIYVLLEKEVQARATIIEERKQIEADLAHVEEAVAALKKEAEIVSLSYRIDDVDLKTKLTLGNKVEKLNARFMLVEEEIDKQEQSYSILLKALSEIKESVTQLKKLNEESMAMLKKLRKDELEAQEKIATLKQQLFHARRLIQRHNLPGLSDEYLILFDEASEHLYDVEEQLSKKPLDIPAMNYALEKAIEVCEKCLLMIEELVETALLSEKVIQYGNRFRSQYPFVEKALIEAEAAFRRYDYEASLEIAGRALQKVDSDTFKQLNVEIEKIESSVSVH